MHGVGWRGHHHNGDQATRRPYILCSICVHSRGDLSKVVWLFMASLHSQPMCSQMRLLTFWRSPISWLKFGRGTFCPLNLVARKAHSVALPWVHSSYQLPIDIWSISYVFELLSWLQKPFSPSVCPIWIRWQLPLQKLLLHRAAGIGIGCQCLLQSVGFNFGICSICCSFCPEPFFQNFFWNFQFSL